MRSFHELWTQASLFFLKKQKRTLLRLDKSDFAVAAAAGSLKREGRGKSKMSVGLSWHVALGWGEHCIGDVAGASSLRVSKSLCGAFPSLHVSTETKQPFQKYWGQNCPNYLRLAAFENKELFIFTGKRIQRFQKQSQSCIAKLE